MWNVTIAHAPIRYYRFVVGLVLLVFPVLAGSVVYKLNRLEGWRVDTVALPSPIAVVYDQFGYWPAVLVVPAIGVACCLIFLYRIKVLKATAKREECAHDLGSVATES